MNFGYKKLYIDGQLTDAVTGGQHNVICPGTEEEIAEVAWAGRDDTLRALESAQAGFKYWSKLSIKDRTTWMHNLRDAVIAREAELRESIMYEMGKPWEGTAEDIESLTNSLQWYPEEMKRLRDEMIMDEDNSHTHAIISQPVGVVVAILAWNFPLLNLAFKIGPALASGCSIIIKPSEYSPLSAYILGEICDRINFPKGVINILCGNVEDTGILLCESKIPQLITMIGSSATGMKLIAQSATSVKRMSMELGGNAPAIVFADADIEKAVADLAALKYGNCGQICVSPNRIFVQQPVYDRFVQLFSDKAKAVKVGFGKYTQPSMGPLINQQARQRVSQMVTDAINDGAKLVTGGKEVNGFSKGYFYEPTVLSGVTPNMAVYKKEVFGPVASLLPFNDIAEVIELANDTDAGLVAYVYTNNMSAVQHLTRQLDFGEIQVNGFKYAIYLPHGGMKQSGIGKDCSQYALDDYLVKKRVTTLLQ